MFTLSRQVDWLVLWKWYYYPLFFWSYVVCGIPLKFIAVSRLGVMPRARAWVIGSTVSAPFVFLMPLAALPAFAIVILAAGHRASYSMLLAFPIALSVGLFGALLDMALFRFALRNRVSANTFWLMFTTNALNVFLAIIIVLAWAIAYPKEVIASLSWR